MDFFEAAQQDRRRREEEDVRAASRQIAEFGPVTGKATSGAVTVQAGSGGMLEALEIAPSGMNRGAAALRADIMAAAKKATARANHRTQQAFGRALGASAGDVADRLGLSYDPALLDEPDTPDRNPGRRT